MRTATALFVLLLSGCAGAGQYFPEVYIDHADMGRYATAAENVIFSSDLDGNGITEGPQESQLFWEKALFTAGAIFVPPPADR